MGLDIARMGLKHSTALGFDNIWRRCYILSIRKFLRQQHTAFGHHKKDFGQAANSSEVYTDAVGSRGLLWALHHLVFGCGFACSPLEHIQKSQLDLEIGGRGIAFQCQVLTMVAEATKMIKLVDYKCTTRFKP